MYADDIIPYSIGDTIEHAVTLLNQALSEVYIIDVWKISYLESAAAVYWVAAFSTLRPGSD